jgi:thiamine biosynthesis protein ThiS
MPATLTAVGILKTYLGGAAEVSVEAERTVHEILSSLEIPPELVALVTVNDLLQTKEYKVAEGDKIKILAVMGGG